MKILQVCPYFYPYLAGQEKYVLQLSKKLQKYGEKVEVFTMNHSKLQRCEEIENIRVHRFNIIATLLNNPISIEFLYIFPKLKYFDIIHIHNEHSFSSFIIFIYNIFNKKPLVLTCHGQLIFGSALKDWFEKIYSRTVGKLIFNSATKIIALSEEDKGYISSLGIKETKILVLPNAIEIDDLNKKVLNQEFNSNIIEKFVDKRVILFVGRIIERKGIEYIIKCIPKVIENFNDTVFVLIGNGEYKLQAEKFCEELEVEEHVIFLSNISDTTLFDYYKSAEIFILPSLSEGLPTTILESMYFGIPVISTDIPGIRSHFKDNAILIPPKNEKELSKAIIRLLSDKEFAMSLRIKGNNLVTGKYTWDKVSKEYINIYHEILHKDVMRVNLE